MNEKEFAEIVKESRSLSDVSNKIFGVKDYGHREKVKKMAKEFSVVLDFSKPKRYCKECGKEITGRDRNIKIFCSSSCAASYNNRLRGDKTENFCPVCGKKIGKRSKYCSNECYNIALKDKFIEQWKNGETSGTDSGGFQRSFIRYYLLKKNDCKCEKCGFSGENPYTKLSVLQVHHIDGNPSNNVEENLQLLCPNCHSMTENYGRLNDKTIRRYKK